MTKFICFCILLMNWIVIPIKGVDDQFRLPKETFFDIVCMGIIVIALYRGVRYLYNNKCLAWLTGWVLATVFFNWYIPYTNTFGGVQTIKYITISPTLHFILALVATFMALSTLEKKDFVTIAKTICISATLLSVFGILQLTSLNPGGARLKNMVGGNNFTTLIGHPTLTAHYIVMALPLFIAFFKDFRFIIGFIICLIGLSLSGSTISMLVFGLMFPVMLLLIFRNRRIAIWLFVIFFIIVGVLAYMNLTPERIEIELNGRMEIWNIAIEHLKDNPLFGQGLGSFKAFNDKNLNGKILVNPHCDWLLIAIELGLIGVFLSVLTIINSLCRFDYSITNILGIGYLTSFVSFILIMCGSFPLLTAPTALIGLVGFWAIEKS